MPPSTNGGACYAWPFRSFEIVEKLKHVAEKILLSALVIPPAICVGRRSNCLITYVTSMPVLLSLLFPVASARVQLS